MAEDHPTISTSRIDASDVARRSFGTVRRGFDPQEVRSYLELLAKALEHADRRQQELLHDLQEAEERARNPVIDESVLTSSLGQRSAAVLRGAHEEASRILAKAKEAAGAIVRDAQQQATDAQVSAESSAAERIAEAELEANALRQQAREEAAATLEAAREEAGAVVDRAREHGRAILDQAQEARRRVLADMAQRRRLVTDQIELLRAARDEIAGSVVGVRRSLDGILEDLSRAEDSAREAAAGEAGTHSTNVPEPLLVEEAERAIAELARARSTDVMGGTVASGEAGSAGGAGEAGTAGGGEADLVASVRHGSRSVGRASQPATSEEVRARPAIAVLRFDDIATAVVEPAQELRAEGHPSLGGADDEAAAGPGGAAPVGAGLGDAAPGGTGPGVPLGAAAPGPVADGAVVHDWQDDPALATGGARRLHDVPEPPEAPEVPDPATSDAKVSGSGVEELFARLRARQRVHEAEVAAEEGTGTAARRAPPADDADAAADGPTAEPVGVATAVVQGGTVEEGDTDHVGSGATVTADSGAVVPVDAVVDAGDAPADAADGGGADGVQDMQAREGEVSPDAPAFARRADALDPIVVTLARKLKRALQDDQNGLLERLRQGTGEWSEELLAEEASQQSLYAKAAMESVRDAMSAGTAFARSLLGGRQGRVAPPDQREIDALSGQLASTVVALIRRRLEGGEVPDAAERIGAAYREWRGERIERLAEDGALQAFSKGVLAGAGRRSVRWSRSGVGPGCADCEDNALAGYVAAGAEFPTGHRHPPAHAGCRCLVLPTPS